MTGAPGADVVGQVGSDHLFPALLFERPFLFLPFAFQSALLKGGSKGRWPILFAMALASTSWRALADRLGLKPEEET
jgi:hypothetical protein